MDWVLDRWAEPSVNAEDWAEAAKICKVGLTYLPDDSRLKNNLKVFEDRAKKK